MKDSMNFDWYIIRGADSKPLRRIRPVATSDVIRRMVQQHMKQAHKTIDGLNRHRSTRR